MPPKANPSASRGGRPSQASGEQGSSTAPSASSPPGRPPVQRLQSLNKRTPGPSLSNRAAIGLDDPDKPKPAIKFKPRAQSRRTKEERDAILKVEEERNRQRLEEAAAIQRSRLGPVKKVRGAFRGRGGASFVGSAGSRGGSMRGGRFDMGSRASSISRHSMPAWGAGGDEGPYYSSDEDKGGIRTSIDQINLDRDGDEDDEVVDKKGKKAVRASRPTYGGPLPIRVIRHEHEERVVGVNTEASSSTSAELRRQAKEKEKETDDGLFVPAETEEGQRAPAVKPEPTEDDVSMADLPPAHVEDDDENPLPEQTTKARKTVTIKDPEDPDPRSLLRTREDIEEFARHNEDLEMMREILALEEEGKTTAKPSEAADTETDSTSEPRETTDEENAAAEKHAGKLFLIQFPPLTPNLAIPSRKQTDGQNDEDVMITHSNTRADQPEVKVENEDDDTNHIKQPNKLVTAVEQQLPAGRVGRLNLHKSGKVTLDWGGISFELDKGADVNFNQEALIASTPAIGAATAGEQEDKQVWAMGELSGKFVASPEWNRLL